MILTQGDRVHLVDRPCLIAFAVNFHLTRDFDKDYETVHVADPRVTFVESGAHCMEEY